MINIPLPDIKKKISDKTGLSESEIDSKIKEKLEQLSGLISEEGAAHIVANELKVKLFDVEAKKIKIGKLLTGMKGIEIEAKILQKYEVREFKTEKYEGKVGNMLIGDETGICRLVMWNDKADYLEKVKEGDVVRLTNCYVKENQERKEIHMGNASKMDINPEGLTVDVKPRDSDNNSAPTETTRKNIVDIKETDSNIEVLATIVQVFDINFFEVCPDCRKRSRMKDNAFNCPTHGPITPDFNYVLNIYLDDGTDNMRAVLWREQVEQLLGMNHTQVLGFKENPGSFETIKTDLLGNIVKATGRANKNQNFDRIEFVINKIDKNPNPNEEIKKLQAEVDKSPITESKDSESATKSQTPEPVKKEAPKSAAPTEKKSASKGSDDLEELDLDSELMDLEDL